MTNQAPVYDEAMEMCSASDYQPMTNFVDFRKFMMSLETKNALGQTMTSYALFLNATEKAGQRIGQGFMNALPEALYAILTGTLIDPFHDTGWKGVFVAIDYLKFRDVI